MADLMKNIDYQELIERIGNTYQSAKSKIISAVNTEMLHAYWQIGKDIIQFEQGGKLKAEYGKQTITESWTIRELRRQKNPGCFTGLQSEKTKLKF